jgi:hypothetical protein
MVDAGSVQGLQFAIDGAVMGSVRGRLVPVGSKLAGVSVSNRELSQEIAEHVLGSLFVP